MTEVDQLVGKLHNSASEDDQVKMLMSFAIEKKQDSNWLALNELFGKIDLGKLAVVSLIAIVRITWSARSQLDNWHDMLERCKRQALAKSDKPIDRLFRGLNEQEK